MGRASFVRRFIGRILLESSFSEAISYDQAVGISRPLLLRRAQNYANHIFKKGGLQIVDNR